MKPFLFQKFKCVVLLKQYADCNPALLLVDHQTHEPICKATINFPGELAFDEVAIKNYSENKGVLECLIHNKIITPPHRYLHLRNNVFDTRIPVCYICHEELQQ